MIKHLSPLVLALLASAAIAQGNAPVPPGSTTPPTGISPTPAPTTGAVGTTGTGTGAGAGAGAAGAGAAGGITAGVVAGVAVTVGAVAAVTNDDSDNNTGTTGTRP